MTDPLLPSDPVDLGGYRLLGRLGQGGMGAVYLGQDANGRLVAVKMIRPEYADDTEFRGRFRSEVNRARQVPPFCTAEVLDADPDHPTPYLVVEYVDGPSLAEVITRNGPLGGGSLHSVAVGVATALAAIHGAGVIHRDLKPANVLFALGTPKVIDFGIARAFEVTSQHTRTDQMVGTVSYMAPERFDTERRAVVGPAADVFAWGAVVTYAGTGRTPFRADSPAATAARILTQPPELSGLPDRLREVVARTLAKDPTERPTAHELLDLLLDLDTDVKTKLIRPELLQAATAARRTSRFGFGGRRPDRVRRTVLAGVAVLALGVTGVITANLLPRLWDGQSGAPHSTVGADTSGPTSSSSRVVGRPAIIDRLDRPGQWTDSRSDAEGRCVFGDGRLEARTGMSPVYRCHGPQDSFKDQTVTVDATVLTPGACAAIWFRAAGANAYLVSLCETEVRLGVDTDDGVTQEARAAVAGAVLGHARRVGVVVQGDKATVEVDDAPLITTALGPPSLTAGRVTFGVIDDVISGDARAGFARVEVTKL
ncbi:serine/threonine-protein kinase [Micromonospora sp. NPDC005979]|uniref:serine/threonine-protein kinase n=1 Tax=Micromonospora sp. NPDC005979 TaxID=3156726 RepID=UPI0033B75B55